MRRHVLAARHHGRGFGNERGFPALSRRGRKGKGNRRYSGSGEGNGGRSVPPAGSRDHTDSGEPSDRNPQAVAFSLAHHTVVLTKGPMLIRIKGSALARSPRRSTPFVARGSAPFFAPPLFEAFRERSRRGTFLLFDRVTPRIDQSGASCPTPPPSHQARRPSGWRFGREKFGREMSGGRCPAGDLPPRLPQEPSVHSPASLTRPAEIVAARWM